MCFDLSLFSEVSIVTGVTISLPNGTSLPITHTGIIRLSDTLILHNVLHVPSFKFNLLSVSSLLKCDRSSAHFTYDSCIIQDHTQGLTIGRGHLMHNLYILQPSYAATSSHVCGSFLVYGVLWHQRFGHPSTAKLQLLSGNLSMSKLKSECPCDICPLAKQKRLPFVSNNHFSSSPFDLIYLDFLGPFSVESVEGHRYFLTIVDDCSRVIWVYMLKKKSDVTRIFPDFVTHVHNQYGILIKSIRSDNAPELAL